MSNISFENLLKARVHLGHCKKNWNPKMAPFLFGERKGVHIIDLNKTMEGVATVQRSLKNIAESGRKIMFVGTKRQASKIIEEQAKRLKQPYVTQRWLGGTLTNFVTIRKSLKKLINIEKIKNGVTYKNLAKREKLALKREQDKLAKLLGGFIELNRIPSALFVVDVKNEQIAVKEARKIGIPVYGIVDSNSDPTSIDGIIPGNDDSVTSIQLLLGYISNAIEEGIQNREKNKSKQKEKVSNNKVKIDKGREYQDGKTKSPSSKRIVKKIISTDKSSVVTKENQSVSRASVNNSRASRQINGNNKAVKNEKHAKIKPVDKTVTKQADISAKTTNTESKEGQE